ncbi:MAG: histidinol dehydrogenase [Candidatus Cyclobacteriaceae bacterium M2_1C_046]
MIKIIDSPDKSMWPKLSARPVADPGYMTNSVRNILNRVKTGGDTAVLGFTEQFDKVKIDQLKVSEEEISNADSQVPEALKKAIDQAYSNIRKFHEAQQPENVTVETMPGITCKLKYSALTSVGLYIPGGTAPLFSTVLMLGVPAVIAGCKSIYLCSPPNKDGEIHPAILYAASKCGINTIFKAGGAQAIAAMAYGTENIPKADKIFGPGNQFVTLAKQLINMEGVAIDMPAGPSEVAIYADETAVPAFLSADLLSQAEHGADSQVLLISTDKEIIKKTQKELEKQIKQLPRKEVALQALNNSKAIYFKDVETAFEFINEYAPEHFIIASERAGKFEDKVINAGSVFLGNYTPESAGDYASGTNHTLPTNGAARAYSGISLLSFMKTITFQELNHEGVKNLAEVVETMAEHEQLEAHRLAMALRRENLK